MPSRSGPVRNIGAAAAVVVVLLSGLVGATSSTVGADTTRITGLATVGARAERADPPEPPSAPAPVPAPVPAPPTDPGDQGAAAAVVEIVNRHRSSAGLGPVAVDGPLVAAASEHSTDQASRQRMGHDGSDGSRFGERITRNGGTYRTAGENVAVGYPTPESVMTGWMGSSGHRANILGSGFTRIGVAVAVGADGRPYWTMVLAG